MYCHHILIIASSRLRYCLGRNIHRFLSLRCKSERDRRPQNFNRRPQNFNRRPQNFNRRLQVTPLSSGSCRPQCSRARNHFHRDSFIQTSGVAYSLVCGCNLQPISEFFFDINKERQCSQPYAAPFSRPHLSVGCKQPVWPHDASPAMTTPREQRPNDTVELLPLKSALVNNNYKDEDTYFPPPITHNPSSSNLYDYTLLSKRTPASKRLQRAPQAAPTPLLTLCGAPPPSRKREEMAALANLRKKVSPALLQPDKNANKNDNEQSKSNTEEVLDNRPKLLQRVLHSKPVSMVVQWSEVRTAWQDSDFITESLCWHNVYRQRHGAPQLYMAPELCDYAQAWANHLAHTNRFYYRNDRDVGQNLYQRPVSAIQPDVTGQEVSSYWYAAVRQYNFFKESDVLHANVNAGHFTQMVWVATTFFGVGKARSRDNKVIVVANYSPPGNLSGQFEANVLPPLPDNFPDLPPPPEH